MTTKNFLQEVETGFKAPVYLLYSNDQYLIDNAILTIKKTIPETETDLNFNTFDLDNSDGNQTSDHIIGTLNTIPFFGGRRYVIVKNLQKILVKDLKKFQIYIANPSPYSVLIMLNNGNIKKELKENTKGIKTICLDIKERDIPLWIKEKIKQNGLTINDEAIQYLIEIVGADVGLLSSEVEKLLLSGNKTIDIDSIREIVEGSREYSVFDLTNALRDKNARKVFKIYRILSETNEPYNLLGVINWQYSRMFASEGKNPSSESVRRYYTQVFELLNEADIRIKSSGGNYPMEYLLFRLLRL
jgi:DNA polymerase-3 subunit delta